jgi:hypothetical protein
VPEFASYQVRSRSRYWRLEFMSGCVRCHISSKPILHEGIRRASYCAGCGDREFIEHKAPDAGA